ncbi:NAD(P)/FAD-dependent oxidoreductase [Streptomyces sp. NBC_00654]|uniref:NAD(P)/FAD-dependent oxidoreductase n=1 Tax=Streptomyces sp. NBC_00654 TaxID=2975799 RepID=UPI00224CA7CA|nr:FAD-dependent oxidoreductase [Streptomyces sp. NBC_00654]MCX4970965.1 FAD-binding oxidoreductase [Streptomyces sp. NBC_00654]
MPVRADIAVVGGGIVGCLIARHITARAPGTSVVILDRETVGGGASRRSAGLHCPRGATERVRRMARYSQDYYAELRDLDPALSIHRIALSVVASEASGPRLRQIYLDSARLTPADGPTGGSLGIRHPEKSQAWNCEGAQYADVYALVQALTRDLRHLVSFREGVGVEAIEPDADDRAHDGEDVALRLSTGETLTAHQVVLAPGPWLAAPAWRDLVAPLGARVKKIIALHIDRPPAAGDRAVVFQDEDAFLLPLKDRGHWLFSYTCQEWDVDPGATANGLSPDNVGEARESLRRYVPELAEQALSGRVFCDAYSSTGEPEVRALDADGRIVFAGAAGGSGYRLAPAIASDAVDLLRLPAYRSHPAQNQRSHS